jgi:hypothetical protein
MLYPADRAVLKVGLLALALLPGVALAEVSDKEPAVQLFWTVGLVAAFLCLLSARFKPWLGVVVFAPAALWFTSLFLEIHSADVGPYLRLEQGTAYYVQAYAAFAVVLFGLIGGVIWHRQSSLSSPRTLG